MSDTSQGDGWWIASDGKWYPPEATPGPVTPPPTPTPPAPAPATPPAAPPVDASKPFWKRAWFIIVAILVVIVVIAAIAGSGDDDEPNDSADQDSNSDVTTDDADGTDDTGASGNTDTGASDRPEPTGTELDDFISCRIVDEDTLVLEVVNNSSETSSYFITIVYRDDAGTRLGDEFHSINNLRPGERTIEEAFSFDMEGAQCEAADVDRFSSQSATDELDDANACQITGRDVFDDLAADLSVTNNSSETSDYFLTVAFVRDDGTRVGTGSASINAVAPGETAPGDVFTVVEAEASVCEVVAVQRFANN